MTALLSRANVERGKRREAVSASALRTGDHLVARKQRTSIWNKKPPVVVVVRARYGEPGLVA